MKRPLIILLITVSATFSAFAQRTPVVKNPETFQLGSRSVRIPPPNGFTDVTGQIGNDHGRFSPNEKDGLLAISVPDDILSKLLSDTLMPLDVYTKTSISPEIRTIDISPKLYAETVTAFQVNFESLFDSDGRIVADAKKKVDLRVSQVTGNRTTVEFKESKNLGYFQKTDNAFSALMMMSVEVNGRRIPMLVSISLLRINFRLINATVYKRFPTDKDLETISEFTKQWTAAIISVNK